jgi:hypothetical protein
MLDTARSFLRPNRRSPFTTLEVYDGETRSRRENSPWLIWAERIAFPTNAPCCFMVAISSLFYTRDCQDVNSLVKIIPIPAILTNTATWLLTKWNAVTKMSEGGN